MRNRKVNENFYFKTSISIMIGTGAFKHVAKGVDDPPEELVVGANRNKHCTDVCD